MSEADPPFNSSSPPSWQELTKFIDEQSQKTKTTIDFWFKRFHTDEPGNEDKETKNTASQLQVR